MASISTSTALLIGAAVAAVGSGTSGYMQADAASNQQTAQDEALRRANKQEAAAAEAANRANQKKPDMAGILAAAQQAAKGGTSGTMLTGPTGADPNASLGKSSLLGS